MRGGPALSLKKERGREKSLPLVDANSVLERDLCPQTEGTGAIAAGYESVG
jgi:hypothetical protein